MQAPRMWLGCSPCCWGAFPVWGGAGVCLSAAVCGPGLVGPRTHRFCLQEVVLGTAEGQAQAALTCPAAHRLLLGPEPVLSLSTLRKLQI